MVIKQRKNKKPYKYYSEKELTAEVAKMLDIVPEDVKLIHKAYEEALVKHLMEADENEDVEVEYIKGIRIMSKYAEGHWIKHPSQGEMKTTFVPTRVFFSTRFTEWFRERRVAEYRQARAIFNDWAVNSEQQYADYAALMKKWRENKLEELSKRGILGDLSGEDEMELESDRDDDFTTAE